jgi:hypothetical protein
MAKTQPVSGWKDAQMLGCRGIVVISISDDLQEADIITFRDCRNIHIQVKAKHNASMKSD